MSWLELWDTLGEARPDLFSVPPRRLGAADGYPLAFLYLERQAPLPALELTARERELFYLYQRIAYQWTGLAALCRPSSFFLVDQRSPLLQRPFDFFGVGAMSFGGYRPLRQTVLMNRVYRDRFVNEVGLHYEISYSAMLVHEALHGAIGVASRVGPRVTPLDLGTSVEEGVVGIFEMAVSDVYIYDQEPTARQLYRETNRFYRATGRAGWLQEERALLRLVPEEARVSEFATLLVRLAVAAARAESDEEVAALLNELAVKPRTPRQWACVLPYGSS